MSCKSIAELHGNIIIIIIVVVIIILIIVIIKVQMSKTKTDLDIDFLTNLDICRQFNGKGFGASEAEGLGTFPGFVL